MAKKVLLWSLLLSCFILMTSACSAWKKTREPALSEAEMRSALREMLHLALDRSVLQLRGELGLEGENGLGLPPQAHPIVEPLRRLGMGAQIDQLEAQMAQTASQVLAQAKNQMDQQIDRVKIDGAEALLRGADDGASQWLRQQSKAPLMQALRPALHQILGENRAAQSYERLVRTYNKLPLVEKTPLHSLEDFLLDQLLERLFNRIAEEERQIRQNPAALNSPLLRAALTAEIIPTQ